MKTKYLFLFALCFQTIFQKSYTQIIKEQGNDSLRQEKRIIEKVEVLPNGDSIIYYQPDFFDFGPTPKENDNTTVNNKDTSKKESAITINSVSEIESPAIQLSGITTASIDNTKDVGEIPFTEDISPSGARIYTIPILTAPVSSPVPQIALTYNSQAGNGVAGYGWNITGISMITITQKRDYFDDDITVPFVKENHLLDFNNPKSQAWTLDNTRLLLSSIEEDAYGNITSYLYEPLYGKTKVKREADIITAEFSNGAIATYNFNYTPFVPVSELKDNRGTSIYFRYLISDNVYYIEDIYYDNYAAHIHFEYIDRQDFNTEYAGGKEIKSNKLLSKVISYYKDNGGTERELRTYALIHEFKNNLNQLSQLLCSSGTKSLNPLTFTYNSKINPYLPANELKAEGSNDFLLSYFTNNGTTIDYVRGKFTPNSYDDGLISYPVFSTYKAMRTQGSYHEYGSSYSPTQTVLVASKGQYGYYIDSLKVGAGFQKIQPADINGDGKDELIKINFDGITGTKTRLKITVYKPNETGYAINLGESVPTAYSFTVLVEGIVQEGPFISPLSRSYFFGDFKGTGKISLVTVSHGRTPLNEQRTCYYAIIDLESKQLLKEFPYGSFVTLGDPGVICADIDSDGKTEISFVTPNTLAPWEFRSNYDFTNQTQHPELSGNNLHNGRLFFGDLNNDGKMDILMSPPESYYQIVYPDPYSQDYEWEYVDNGNVWTAFYFTGKNFISKTFSVTNVEDGEDYILTDLNKDGCTDLVQIVNGKIYCYLNNKGVISGNFVSNPPLVPAGSKILPVDINNLGKESSFIAIKDFEVKFYSFTTSQKDDNLMTEMSDSYGVKHLNAYKNMTEVYSCYIPNNKTHSEGFNYFIAPLNLLHGASVYHGNNLIGNTYFSYFGGVMHKAGLGFCGFDKMRTNDYINNMESFLEYDAEKLGVITKTTSPTVEATYNYSKEVAANKKITVKLNSSSEKDILKGITAVRTFTYDANDNVTKDSVNYGSNIRMVTDYTYKPVTDKYILGLPESKTVTSYRNSDKWMDKEKYGYNAKYQIKAKEMFTGIKGDKKTGEIRWNYNANDKLVSLTQSPYSVNKFYGDSLVYDTSGRFAAKQINALKKEVVLSNYDKYGNPKTMTDFKNVKTSKVFDEWGKNTSTVFMDGTTEKVEEKTEVKWNSDIGIYAVTSSMTGKPTTIVHYDALNREVRTANQRFDGSWQFTDKQYNNKGQLEKVSNPYKPGGTIQWNTYTYDAYGRPKTLTTAAGVTTSWNYNGNTVTETTNGIATTKQYDPSGLLTSVSKTGVAGSITYAYNAAGQPVEIVNPGNIKTIFHYTDYGIQDNIVDPVAGTRRFEDKYENGVRVVKQTDADNRTVTTYYDSYGRIKRVERPEFYTDYAYNADEMPASEISSNGTSKTFGYDAYNRLKTVKETVPGGKFMEKTYGYKAGNIETVKYASQSGIITTEHHTYTNGHQTEIKLNNVTSVWKLTGENTLGQPTQSQTGVMARAYNYTAYGLPVSRTAGSVQSFGYSFDALKGTLTSRKDNKRNITERFGYDALYQLDSIPGGKITYDVKNNITFMPNMGALRYTNTAKPYTLTEVALSREAIPVREQQIAYTSFQRPATITENNTSAAFTYNAIGNRVKMHVTQGTNALLTRYYIGEQYEIDAQTGVERLYLGGDAYSAPAVYVKEAGNWKIYYICRDYLGSITHVANADGSLKQELSYDAWGRLRNPATQVAYTPGSEPALFLGRGYTGHEHLPWFGLVNMNARLYDAALGRFISPDPYVQDPLSALNYNRYAYAMNNPLVYIDQDGEFPWLIVGIIVGFTYLKAAHDNTPKEKQGNPAQWNWNPLNWDWKNANYTVSVGSNTGPSGGMGGAFSFGWDNGSMINIGYNQKSGPGMGIGQAGTTNMYYPGYDYNKPEKAAMAAVNETRKIYSDFLNYSSTIGSAYGGYHYTGNNFARTGYFRTSKGVIRSLNDLEIQPNGKYLKGVQGMRIGADLARNSVNLLTRTANFTGGITTIYSATRFAINPNFNDGLDATVGLASIAFWEIGFFYLGVDGMIWASSTDRKQIQQNIYDNKNPMDGVYCPGLGMNYYSPF